MDGVTVDVTVADLDVAAPFYTAVLGREPDQRPDPDTVAWRLIDRPEVALRVVRAGPGEPVGRDQVGLGVADLERERERVAALLPDVPEALVRPGVVALCPLRDPDGNTVVLWQDLLSHV